MAIVCDDRTCCLFNQSACDMRAMNECDCLREHYIVKQPSGDVVNKDCLLTIDIDIAVSWLFGNSFNEIL